MHAPVAEPVRRALAVTPLPSRSRRACRRGSRQMASKGGWSTRFDEPIVLPDGTMLTTLRDAIRYLARTVPKAERPSKGQHRRRSPHPIRRAELSPVLRASSDAAGDLPERRPRVQPGSQGTPLGSAEAKAGSVATIPACETLDVIGLVDPAVASSIAPSAPMTKCCAMVCGRLRRACRAASGQGREAPRWHQSRAVNAA